MDNLRVLTFNIWGTPVAKEKGKRVKLICEELGKGDYDIIALQEVWSDTDATTIINRCRVGGLKYSHHFKSGMIGSGIVILSKFPIIETCFWPYVINGKAEKVFHADFFAGKGIALARVATKSGIVDVFSTHLHANYAFKYREEQSIKIPEDEYAGHRVAQMLQLGQTVNKFCYGRNAVLVMGDFNARPNQLEIRLFEALTQSIDVFATMCPGNPGYTINSSDNTFCKHHEPKERLDFICFHAGGTKWEPVSSNLAMMQSHAGISYSDHYAVAAQFSTVELHEPVLPPDHVSPGGRITTKILKLAASVLTADIEAVKRRETFGKLLTVMLFVLGLFAVPLTTHFSGEKTSEEHRWIINYYYEAVGGIIAMFFAMLSVAAFVIYVYNSKCDQRALSQAHKQVDLLLDACAGYD